MASNGKKPTVIAIVGPTASGKTALSLHVASKLAGEIVACDSRTVYRHFDIGTAKPTTAERNSCPHHLIDVVEPDEHYTVSEFVQDAGAAINDILARKKMPIVCGGTGFYARALLEGLSIPDVQPQEQLRLELNAFADQHGNQALYDRLLSADPVAAAKLNVNDRFRITRALEVIQITGKPFSQVAGRCEPPYNTIWLGLNTDERPELHRRIRTRFQQQLQDGLVEETERLHKKYGAHPKLMNTVNYKQILQFIAGESTLESALELAIQHNIQLARRQIIWFRSNPDIQWLAVDKLNSQELCRSALGIIETALSS